MTTRRISRRMTWLFAAATGAVAVATLALWLSWQGHRTTGAIPSGAVPRLRTIALATARHAGDGHPLSIAAVMTGRDAVPRAYRIVVVGHFMLNDSPSPSGSPVRGRYLTITLGARTFRFDSLGLTSTPPRSLASYGPVMELLVSKPA
jgi:hypothetical protein